jgi:hypothetical protein
MNYAIVSFIPHLPLHHAPALIVVVVVVVVVAAAVAIVSANSCSSCIISINIITANSESSSGW